MRLVADLERIPQFVRPGTILPLAEVAPTTAAQPADHLILSVFCGAAGSARIHEDETGWTNVRTATPDAASCTVTIEPAGARRHTVRLEGTRRPARVTVDGAAAEWRHENETTFVEVPAGATTVAVSADGPLTARGPEHDRAVRAADLRRLLGDPAEDDAALEAAVRALPADHPGRAAAIARIGGPAIQVFEHTAPDEAEAVLGRVVVAAPETGPPARVERALDARAPRHGRKRGVRPNRGRSARASRRGDEQPRRCRGGRWDRRGLGRAARGGGRRAGRGRGRPRSRRGGCAGRAVGLGRYGGTDPVVGGGDGALGRHRAERAPCEPGPDAGADALARRGGRRRQPALALRPWP